MSGIDTDEEKVTGYLIGTSKAREISLRKTADFVLCEVDTIHSHLTKLVFWNGNVRNSVFPGCPDKMFYLLDSLCDGIRIITIISTFGTLDELDELIDKVSVDTLPGYAHAL